MQRRYYIDYLKAIGSIAIVALHVITNRLDHTAVTESNYLILSGLLVLTRWAVPVFVMVSGCNLLGRDNEFELVKKHSVKMLVFALIWGILHLLADPLINIVTGNPVDTSTFTLSYLFQGPAYHLWFCFMIVGLYLLVPILNLIIKNKKSCEYFLFICLFASFVLPLLKELGSKMEMFGTIANHFRFPDFKIYIFYFVLGYYLDRYVDLKKSEQILTYVLAILSVGAMITYGFVNAIQYQNAAAITEPEYFTVVIFSIGIFLFFKYQITKGKLYPLFLKLAQHSFGIYVMHSYLIIRLSWKGIHSTMFSPFLAIPLVTIAVVGVSFAASCLIKKIPVIGKWLV